MKPTCPKCGSKSLYKDDDPVERVSCIACRKCGNRIYGGIYNQQQEGDDEMAKRGTCTNCHRPDQQIIGGGLCGGCYGVKSNAIKNGKDPDQALKDAADRFQKARQEHPSFAGNEEKKAKDSITSESLAPASDVEKRGIKRKQVRKFLFRADLHFYPDDHELYKYLEDGAKANRRTLSQHIFHILDCHFEADKEAAA